MAVYPELRLLRLDRKPHGRAGHQQSRGERVGLPLQPVAIRHVSRNRTDLLRCFPEIGVYLRVLPPMVLDGELVVLDDKGRPLFDRLRRRFAMKHSVTIERTAVSEPAAIFAFDLLTIGDRDVRKLPLERRKSVLKDALHGSGRIRYVEHIGEEGERLYAMAVQLGLEGRLCARRDTRQWQTSCRAPTTRGRSLPDRQGA